jgi:5'-nucleotidase
MVHALNTLKIDCACFGNHEFDFPIEHTLNLIKATNFPWLLGNIRFKNTNVLLGEGRPWMTLDHNGIKIGLMGVAGEDWIDILNEDY